MQHYCINMKHYLHFNAIMLPLIMTPYHMTAMTRVLLQRIAICDSLLGLFIYHLCVSKMSGNAFILFIATKNNKGNSRVECIRFTRLPHATTITSISNIDAYSFFMQADL